MIDAEMGEASTSHEALQLRMLEHEEQQDRAEADEEKVAVQIGITEDEVTYIGSTLPSEEA